MIKKTTSFAMLILLFVVLVSQSHSASTKPTQKVKISNEIQTKNNIKVNNKIEKPTSPNTKSPNRFSRGNIIVISAIIIVILLLLYVTYSSANGQQKRQYTRPVQIQREWQEQDTNYVRPSAAGEQANQDFAQANAKIRYENEQIKLKQQDPEYVAGLQTRISELKIELTQSVSEQRLEGLLDVILAEITMLDVDDVIKKSIAERETRIMQSFYSLITNTKKGITEVCQNPYMSPHEGLRRHDIYLCAFEALYNECIDGTLALRTQLQNAQFINPDIFLGLAQRDKLVNSAIKALRQEREYYFISH